MNITIIEQVDKLCLNVKSNNNKNEIVERTKALKHCCVASFIRIDFVIAVTVWKTIAKFFLWRDVEKSNFHLKTHFFAPPSLHIHFKILYSIFRCLFQRNFTLVYFQLVYGQFDDSTSFLRLRSVKFCLYINVDKVIKAMSISIKLLVLGGEFSCKQTSVSNKK